MRHESFDGWFLTRYESNFGIKEIGYTYDFNTSWCKCTTIDMLEEYEDLWGRYETANWFTDF